MTEEQRANYHEADLQQKFEFLIDLTNKHQIRIDHLADVVEARATRLNEIGLRLDLAGNRLDALEGHMNTVLLSHNREQAEKAELDRWQKAMTTMLIAVASLGLGSISISVAVLIALMNHVIGK